MLIRDFLVNFIGNIELMARKCGNKVQREKYKKRLKACGEKVSIGNNCKLIPEHISIGNHVVIGDDACILASIANVYIGNHVILGPNVTIRGGDHRFDIVGRYIDSITEQEKLPENDKDVHIKDDVWIGGNVIILKGVTIGEGAIIGAGSIVTKDVPPYTIHIGVHAPYEKKRFSEKEIEQHKKKLKML